jgi:hypothetical protein
MARCICRRQRPVRCRHPKTAFKAFLSVIPLDLFALIRSRSMGGEFLDGTPAFAMMQCNIATVNSVARPLCRNP